MYKPYRGRLTDLSKENQKTIKEDSTTFYPKETRDGYGYVVYYRNGYGISFSKMNGGDSAKKNLWAARLMEKTSNGWTNCWNSPMGDKYRIFYSNQTDDDIVNLCKQIRDVVKK